MRKELAIKVHNGNGHTKGKAREYQYFIASLFEHNLTVDGRLIWRNTGRHVGPFRSEAKTIREAEKWASELNVEFINGYGSLHNSEVI